MASAYGLGGTCQHLRIIKVAYLVDTAQADALELLGETRQALDLLDRHV